MVKKLFALSGNQCCMPDCSSKQPLYDEKEDILYAKIAHIYPANKDSRFKSGYSDEELRSFDNLLLVCANCHERIDQNPNKYPAANLQKIKDSMKSRTKRENC